MTTTAIPTTAAGTTAPPDTRPPNKPGTPPPPKDASRVLLAVARQLVAVEQDLTESLGVPTDKVEAAGQAILLFRLDRAQAAVADLLQYSGRDGKDIAAAVASRPVQPPAGRPPASGGDFLLPRDVRPALSAALNRRAE